MEVVKEYQAQGKIKFIGFSSHGTVDVIVSAIETGLFDYVNLHYHFIGSYVSTGTGPCGGNLAALKAAQKQDMGVFIISPSDKGDGASFLCEPSHAMTHPLGQTLSTLTHSLNLNPLFPHTLSLQTPFVLQAVLCTNPPRPFTRPVCH